MKDPIDQALLDPAVKKTVLRMFTYGLYAVGVAQGDDQNLFTANWLTQVSFEPPFLALSVENDSYSIELIRQSRVFAISVFSADSRQLAAALGKRRKVKPDKLDQIRYRLGTTGCPILEEALGAVECLVTGELPAGDSTLFLAEVIHVEAMAEGIPLTMAEAGFRHAG